MARRNRFIQIFGTPKSAMSRIDWGDYYSVESAITPGVTYVLDEDVVAVVMQNGTVLLSPDIIDEIVAMNQIINDADNKRIFRNMRNRRERKDDR